MRLRFLCWPGLAFTFLLFFDALESGRCASDEASEKVGDNHDGDGHLNAGKDGAHVLDSNKSVTIDGEAGEAEEKGGKEVSGSGSSSEDGPTDPPQKEDIYFYRFDKDSVVTEFEAPSNDEEKANEKPDFLYNPTPGRIRIVEFYAHWCPHCQHFREKYNKFARRIKEIAKQNDLEVDVYAISCVPHRPLCRDQDVHGFPRIKVYVGNGGKDEEGITIPYSDLHPFSVVKTISEKTGKDLLSALDELEDEDIYGKEGEGNSEETARGASSFWLHRTKRDIYHDIYLSFHFAMEHSVFVGKAPPDEPTREAFRDWISLLNQVLPPTWELQSFISEIAENIDTVLDSEENLMAIVNKHPPPKRAWSRSCSRGNKNMGYTCGLWELFHTVTIGVIEWNLNGSVNLSYTPEEVGSIFRSYIERFFGCEVCRTNFIHEYDSCAFNRCNRLIEDLGEHKDWKELPLWLFELHNGVNLRLLKEKAERELRKVTQTELTAVEWPSRRDCPQCWISDGRFDPDSIYKFLQKTYWPSMLITKVETTDEDRSEGGIESWVFSLIGFLIASFVLSSVAKQNEIRRTGKHKKADDDDDFV